VRFPIVHRHLHVYTSDEIREAFDSGIPIYFDTMVFRNLWKLHSNPRVSLLESIRGLNERTYLPHQVQVELHRQSYSDAVLNSVPTPGLYKSKGTLESAMESVLAEVEKVRPQNQEGGATAEQILAFGEAVRKKFVELFEWHKEVDGQLRDWLGDQVDVTAIRRGHATHILLDEIAAAFRDGHLLESPGDVTLKEWRSQYVQRVNQDEPVGPGKTDRNKASVDEAAGDYYVWKEMLAHCVARGSTNGFIFVTEERKPDLWEVQQGEKALRRIDPRIQAESIEATGGPMHVLTFDEFLDHAISDAGTREILSNISQDASSSASSWSEIAYAELLEFLSENGFSRQRDVIIGAAMGGGYIDRAQIGEILNWGDTNRYLTRFRMPADRAKNELVARGQVSHDASDPLWAVYDRPGEALGYAVPNEFSDFQLRRDVNSDTGDQLSAQP
jgi:hypothetical protein